MHGRVHWWMAAIAVYLLSVTWHYPTGVSGTISSPTWTRYGAAHNSSPFLEYVKNDTLFLQIEKMNILIYSDEDGYYNLTSANYTELMSLPSHTNITNDSSSIHFWKSYQYNETNTTFFLNFTIFLETTSTDQTWYVDTFTHHNRTESGNCTFEYKGMSQAIYAPSDVSYFCSNLTFHGDCVEGIKSEVQFTGLRIQAFGLNKDRPSSTYIDCGAKSHNNSIINVVVGSVVGSTLFVAVMVIIVTLIMKKVRRNSYNLLD